jgi:probable F420-dependent oxidoreductase
VPKIKFGLQFPNVMGYNSFEHLRKIAETAEELSFDSIWTSDHVLPIDKFQKSGRPGIFESVTCLGYLSAVTKRVTIGSSVLLPLRHPLLLATMLNTIDHSSQGRLQVGYGVGWYRPEFENMDVPFAKRGKIATEQLRILKELWTKPSVDFQGEFYKLHGASVVPEPVQKPHPPILIGGSSKQSFVRAVELGDGWMPFSASVNGVRRGVDEMKKIAGKKGLKDDFILYLDLPTALKSSGSLPQVDEDFEESLIGEPTTIVRRIEKYKLLGVQQIIVELEKPGNDIENLKAFHREIISRF